MSNLVLSVDSMGFPVKWITAKRAVCHYAKGEVVWELGGRVESFHSGFSRVSGERTVITPASIVALDGQAIGRVHEGPPRLTRGGLFERDRRLCAYCGDACDDRKITKDHIRPLSKGGRDVWMNVVTACKGCNMRKADTLLEHSGLQLLYAPYTPSRNEGLILRNRKIMADQMEFLMAKVPKSSRLWPAAK